MSEIIANVEPPEITPEMIRAGCDALAGYSPNEHVEAAREEFVIAVYEAMALSQLGR